MAMYVCEVWVVCNVGEWISVDLFKYHMNLIKLVYVHRKFRIFDTIEI